MYLSYPFISTGVFCRISEASAVSQSTMEVSRMRRAKTMCVFLFRGELLSDMVTWGIYAWKKCHTCIFLMETIAGFLGAKLMELILLRHLELLNDVFPLAPR